ncbi:MAG: CocE/NonD family hydrolase C-terminal non-catalytic domain-containing protein [Thermodesulfobacteriota bacterium]
MLKIRQADGTFEERKEKEWPLRRTIWTKLYLDAEGKALVGSPVSEGSQASHEALGNGVRFISGPFAKETEITGPVMANLWVSSSTQVMDIFATL